MEDDELDDQVQTIIKKRSSWKRLVRHKARGISIDWDNCRMIVDPDHLDPHCMGEQLIRFRCFQIKRVRGGWFQGAEINWHKPNILPLMVTHVDRLAKYF